MTTRLPSGPRPNKKHTITASANSAQYNYAGNSVQALAEELGRTIGSVSQTLYRIRAKLAKCVKRALNAEHRDEP